MIKKKQIKFNKYQYLGAIHVHTAFSDGTGNVNTITKAAKKAGLDWIIITDHNAFEIKEGIYNGVYVIKGEEITPSNGNHYLALGIEEHIKPTENSEENINNVRNYGGFGFVAHPDERVYRKNSYKAIKWEDKSLTPDGIEIWNWFSQWGDMYNSHNIFNICYSYLFRHKLVNAPYKSTLSWWDKLNNNSEKIIPAIGGIDAHALKIKKYFIPVTIFAYEEMFGTITNVLSFDEPLHKDFKIRKKQILLAIKEGKNTIVNRKISKSIPHIDVISDSKSVGVGEHSKLREDSTLRVLTNKKSFIKIYKDGKEIKRVNTKNLSMVLNEVGKYRVEIMQKDKGFAYTNPIVIE